MKIQPGITAWMKLPGSIKLKSPLESSSQDEKVIFCLPSYIPSGNLTERTGTSPKKTGNSSFLSSFFTGHIYTISMLNKHRVTENTNQSVFEHLA